MIAFYSFCINWLHEGKILVQKCSLAFSALVSFIRFWFQVQFLNFSSPLVIILLFFLVCFKFIITLNFKVFFFSN